MLVFYNLKLERQIDDQIDNLRFSEKRSIVCLKFLETRSRQLKLRDQIDTLEHELRTS